ncbi:uncharacterized protein DDB_G0286299-like [Anoplophora glabripennis]|nr:uncharacterized protein DDB_G0286299-like [Anoplophora glabripennis]
MDVDTKAAHQENDAKHTTEDAPQKSSPKSETNGSTKDTPKHNSRQKRGESRSRSQTPQKKTEDAKTLHITLKKLDSELNGKDIQEEKGKIEEKDNDNKVEINDTKEDKPAKEDSTKVEKESSKDKQTEKQKEEKPKKEEVKKGNTQEKKEKKKIDSVKKETPKKDKKDKGKSEAKGQVNEPDTEPVEMDPLVISDEPDPELQFDENSDVESGKGSPVISRCVTRRSQTRNIPTPKTPKSVDQDMDSEKNSATYTPITDVYNDLPKTDNLNDTCESMDTINLSTKAEVGSDLTRMDYMEHHTSIFEDSSYISASREKSLSETLRGLSARRPIRPLDDYRRRVLRSNLERSDLNMPYPSHNPVEQIITGIKRKSRSITPEDRKKFKTDSPGMNSLFSSPFTNIRNKFKTDLPSSTPKLLSYRDTNTRLHYNDDNFENGDDEKKSWCSIM